MCISRGKRKSARLVCLASEHSQVYLHTHILNEWPSPRQGAQEAAGSTEGGKLKSAPHAQKENLAETTQETEHVF